MATYSAAEQTKLNESLKVVTDMQTAIRNSLSMQATGASYVANELTKVVSRLKDLGAV